MKAALWFAIGKIVDEETLKLGVNASPQFIGALTEMAWAQIGEYPRHYPVGGATADTQLANVSQDLQAFAKHARHTVVTQDDAMLLARRNEGLADIMRDCLQKEKGRMAK